MSKKFELNDELVVNPSTRTPVVLCIDTSGSMGVIVDDSNAVETGETIVVEGETYTVVSGGVTLIDEMANGVNLFYEAIKEDLIARTSCEIAIVTYDDTVEVLEDFSSVDSKGHFQVPAIKGETRMAAGLRKAVDLLEERKRDYKAHDVDYHQPWLLLFTDGKPTDDVSAMQREIRQLEADKKLTVFTFSLDKEEVDISILQGFTKRKTINIKQDKIKEFFQWLGKSVSALSNSTPGESIKLDTTGLDEWASI